MSRSSSFRSSPYQTVLKQTAALALAYTVHRYKITQRSLVSLAAEQRVIPFRGEEAGGAGNETTFAHLWRADAPRRGARGRAESSANGLAGLGRQMRPAISQSLLAQIVGPCRTFETRHVQTNSECRAKKAKSPNKSSLSKCMKKKARSAAGTPRLQCPGRPGVGRQNQ
jgi:hypothetical protein